MRDVEARSPSPEVPEPIEPAQDPNGDPARGPDKVPWHDPGPPVRKVNLPPDSPSPGVPVPPEPKP